MVFCCSRQICLVSFFAKINLSSSTKRSHHGPAQPSFNELMPAGPSSVRFATALKRRCRRTLRHGRWEPSEASTSLRLLWAGRLVQSSRVNGCKITTGNVWNASADQFRCYGDPLHDDYDDHCRSGDAVVKVIT
jgi:hypothetical protein